MNALSICRRRLRLEEAKPTDVSPAASSLGWLRAALLALLFLATIGGLRAQSPDATNSPEILQTGQKLDPLSLQWPRFFSTNGYEFAVYQPQIAKWPGNLLEGRFAIAVRPTGTSNETYGVVFFKARTDIDKLTRLVTLEDFQITKMDFPTQRGMQKIYQTIIQSELPQATKTIPLDHLESTYAVSADVAKVKIQKIENTPPHFIYTTQPSLLVQVDGPPMLKPLVGNYERVMNTRAILLQNTNGWEQGYYLYAASNWYTAPSLEGPWAVTVSPPSDINPALNAAMATGEVDPALPKGPMTVPPTIYLATTPTELLETAGIANLLSINGTDLLYVSNTDQAIFYCLDDSNYYILVSGRWFKCASLYGPWTYVPTGTLPPDFKKIPPDSPKSNVLLSVAGTPQAQEAVISSTIPQTATIYRDKAKLSLEYVGAPNFVAIPGTSLFYAANTTTPVIMVKAKSYYACQGGVWFMANTANGPWTVATSVPTAIYGIPASCPIHYVTYSYVYGFTPRVVYVGYTPGYMGVIVAPGGVVVYGTGYYYPPVVVGTTYVSYPPTYGSGASMALGAAVGFAFGYCAGHNSNCYYEPHWGCYSYHYPYSYSYAHCNVNSCNYYSHWGTATATGHYGYNPYTGTSYRSGAATGYNPYTGTHANTVGGAAYNPYTGTAAGGRSTSAYNPYSGASATSRASASANVYSGNYNATRQTSGYNPTTGTSFNNTKSVSGNAYNGTASVNNSGTAHNYKTGNSYAWNNGNVAADHNGNIYTSGNTAQNRSTAESSWSNSSGQRASASQSSWASRESSAQATGSQRASAWGQSGGGGGGWGHGGDSGGWGGDRSSGWGGGGGRFSRGGGGWSRGGGGFHRR